MQNPSLNKAMKPAETQSVSHTIALDAWQFSGDGKKPPITIQAATQEEAVQKYQAYLNSESLTNS